MIVRSEFRDCKKRRPFIALREARGSVVNHINLDGQAEAIKQFFLSLPVGPEGAVVELNGQALAGVVPIAAGDDGHADDQECPSARNERRCQLIDANRNEV